MKKSRLGDEKEAESAAKTERMEVSGWAERESWRVGVFVSDTFIIL